MQSCHQSLIRSFLLLFALPLFGGDGEVRERPAAKPAWEWTLEERMAERYDAVKNKARREAAVAAGRIAPEYDPGFIVWGKHNPELLARWELWSHVFSAFSSDQPQHKEMIKEWEKRGGAEILGEGFVDRLEIIARPMIDADAEFRRIGRQLLETPHDRSLIERSNRMNKILCPTAARTLAAARAFFGGEALERFLYEIVAPDSMIFSSARSPESGVGEAQFVEEGCK